MNVPDPAQKQTRRPDTPKCAPRAPLIVLVALIVHAWPIDAWGARDAALPTAAVAEKRGDLKALRGQIDSLRKDVASSESRRANVADQLQDVERSISATERELTRLARQRAAVQARLKELASALRELENLLGRRQTQLEALVYRQYLQGKPDALRLMLNGDEPSQVARDLHYLAAIARARSALLRDIEGTLQRKQALAADTRERSEELAGVEAEHQAQHAKLVAQGEQRRKLVDKLSTKISAQRREIVNLQRDEKQLAQLIVRLAQQAKAAAAKPAPRRQTTQGRSASEERRSAKADAPELSNEKSPQASTAGNFARLKGALRLPTRGVISNRFGAARQEGSTWKGLFIRAGAGSEVKAIAAGRVVFADWMRGFGNLMIVDHGSSYLSIYGNNEALLKQNGDTVRGGDGIATVGNSGGNPESGLYFELRYQGQPLDPLRWVNLK